MQTLTVNISNIASTGKTLTLTNTVRVEFFQGQVDDFIVINNTTFPLGTYPFGLGDFNTPMNLTLFVADATDGTIGVVIYQKVNTN